MTVVRERGVVRQPSLALVGPPGAGKGTQARLLGAQPGRLALSTGDLLRDEVERITPLGLAIDRYMSTGLLVPDRLVLRLLFDRMREMSGTVPIFDGFPRTIRQALALDQLLEPAALDVVVEITLAAPAIMERLQRRQRSDDALRTIQRRLEVYLCSTTPMLDWYRASGRLCQVDGDQPIDRVHEAIVDVLESVPRSGASVRDASESMP